MADLASPGQPIEGCLHEHQHRHATRAAYVKHACRCDACRAAYSRARKRAKKRIRADAGQARDALAHLTGSGMSLRQASRASGLGEATLSRLSGAKWTSPKVLSRLLATPPNPATRHKVTQAGARRRITALACRGFSLAFLARRLGCGRRLLGYAVAGQRNFSDKLRAAIGALYDDLWDADPIAAGMSARGTDMALAFARRVKAVPPLAWDDDAIDDPNTPTPLDPTRDDTAAPTREQRILEIIDMEKLGIPVWEAASRLGYNTVGALIKASQRWRIPGPYARSSASNSGTAAPLTPDELDQIDAFLDELDRAGAPCGAKELLAA
jgi:lambda repressor-like predicted transcriptional regulator